MSIRRPQGHRAPPPDRRARRRPARVVARNLPAHHEPAAWHQRRPRYLLGQGRTRRGVAPGRRQPGRSPWPPLRPHHRATQSHERRPDHRGLPAPLAHRSSVSRVQAGGRSRAELHRRSACARRAGAACSIGWSRASSPRRLSIRTREQRAGPRHPVALSAPPRSGYASGRCRARGARSQPSTPRGGARPARARTTPGCAGTRPTCSGRCSSAW